MAFTPTQALQAVKDHGLIVIQETGGWRATTRDRTRLGRDTKPTYEDAVEAAVTRIQETAAAAARADKSRLFDLLGSGKVVFSSRDIELPGEPKPERVRVFDIKDATSGAEVVRGEVSLHAAVLAAEERGAFR